MSIANVFTYTRAVEEALWDLQRSAVALQVEILEIRVAPEEVDMKTIELITKSIAVNSEFVKLKLRELKQHIAESGKA